MTDRLGARQAVRLGCAPPLHSLSSFLSIFHVVHPFFSDFLSPQPLPPPSSVLPYRLFRLRSQSRRVRRLHVLPHATSVSSLPSSKGKLTHFCLSYHVLRLGTFAQRRKKLINCVNLGCGVLNTLF